MKQCERCPDTCSWTHDMTFLTGDVAAHLCAACIRDWTGYLDTEVGADWAERLRLEAHDAWLKGRAMAGSPPEMYEWHDLARERDDNRRAMHAHGLAFLARTVDRVTTTA